MRDCTSTDNTDRVRTSRRSFAQPTGRGRRVFRGLLRPGRSLGCLSAWMIVLLIGSSTLQATTLQWRLMPDQRLRFNVERTTRQKSPSMDWTETIQYQVLWVVAGRDEAGDVQLVQKLIEVKHTLQFPGAQPVVYDSSLEGEPRGDAAELARYWKSLLQVERPMTLSAQGRFIRSQAAPSTTSTPASSAPTSATITSSSPTAAIGSGSSSAPPASSSSASNSPSSSPSPTRPSALRLLADVHWVLPAHELALGDSWAETQLAPWRDIADAIKVTTAYTYQGAEEVEEKRLDKIVVQTRWDVQPRPAPRQLSIDRPVGSGVIYFDNEAGHLARAEFSHDLAVRVSPSQVDAVQAEISVVLRIRCHPVIPEPSPEQEPAASPSPPEDAASN
jgi:hypothetical protein